MSAPPPEFHRPLALARIAPATVQEIAASGPECAALARRLGVPAVLALACRFRLTPAPGGEVLAEGWLDARLMRDCVVTLERFEEAVSEHFRLRFIPAAALAAAVADEPLDPDSDDEIACEGAVLDLGEAAAQQLALAMDPYPRGPGATLAELPEDGPESPFAALARLPRPTD